MNKYWIHSCTGQKAELYALPCCDDDKGWVKLIKKEDSDKVYVNNALLLKISDNDFHNYWMSITKAEYDSTLTLEEIKRNRDIGKKNKFIEGLIVVCTSHISDCEDIIPDDIFIVTGYNSKGLICLKAANKIGVQDYEVTLDNFKQHFKIIGNGFFKSKDTFESLCQEMIDVYKAKNHDYGDSFHNLFKELGINYAYGHLKEKLERVKTLKDSEAKVKSESMIDSLKDLANYAIMTIIELQNENTKD